MTTPTAFRFPAPSGRIAELTEDQYAALVGDGGLSRSMLLRIAGAAVLLAHMSEEKPRTLRQIAAAVHGVDEIAPTNMEHRAMVALVAAGLVLRVGSSNQTRYLRVGETR
ncbi:hypothetical protein [Curtobacterium sp. PhB115]|uniref:hypothetical protein n=1 Tax=Curtobacterium sp. PhB115 TaxID=2485173 RepID=UPI000FB10E4F|nr:hypothetical protein [Curtobacterium sp. PhB115]ROP74413.1 hypothetical protein EDF19_0497 [Curtobacterium sp. PhB115]